MPRKRKAQEVSKDDIPCDPTETVVKTECDSEEMACTPEPEATEDEEVPTRNLRPRKSKCYAEKDSPEFEERVILKAPRRKRRLLSSENEAVVKKDKDGGEEKTKDAEPEGHEPTPPRLALHQLPNTFQVPDKNELTASLGLQPVLAPTEKTSDDKPITTVNKPKKRKKKVLAAQNPENKPEALEIPPSLTNVDEPTPAETESCENEAPPPQIKPKPKRIRVKKKPPLPVTTEVHDGSEVVPEPKDADVEVKQEKEEEKSLENKDESESKPPPVKKVVKKSRSKSSKPKPASDTLPDEVKEEPADNEQTKEQAEIKPKKPAPKRIRNRPSKPKPQPIPPVANENDSVEIPDKSTEEKNEQPEAVCTLDNPVDNATATSASAVKISAPVPARKPFIRGRKSKLVSSRTAKKDIVHTDEAIDPEDIRGYEHVEKYVPPSGVRLPKFWDSEDEVSDDETTDNFRRIMCGFGTNCRIHEVIRPASEIVRRLKELQNTFGSTRTLPLFKKECMIPEEEVNTRNLLFEYEKDTNAKKHIMWHSDPAFFKFANNLP